MKPFFDLNVSIYSSFSDAVILQFCHKTGILISHSLICIGIVRIFTPLRVDPKEELVGLDASQHGENAYPSFNGFD